MLKDFIAPDWKKLITYLILIAIFMSETLFLRSVYQRDNVVTFLLYVYNSFFKEIDYVNFFMISFFYYIFVLMTLYILSCIIILIIGKIDK